MAAYMSLDEVITFFSTWFIRIFLFNVAHDET